MQLLDAHTLQVERRIHVGSFAPVLAYSPTGSLLAVGIKHGATRLQHGCDPGCDQADDECGDRSSVLTASMLAAAEADPSTYASHLEVWNLRTHHLQIPSVGPVLGAWYGLWGVAFLPTVIVWQRLGTPASVSSIHEQDVASRPARTASGCTPPPISPDGSVLATGETPGDASGAAGAETVQLLDADTLKPRATIFSSASAEMWEARFSPDGTRVAFDSSETFGVYSVKTHSSFSRVGWVWGSPRSRSRPTVASSPSHRQMETAPCTAQAARNGQRSTRAASTQTAAFAWLSTAHRWWQPSRRPAGRTPARNRPGVVCGAADPTRDR